MFLVVIQQPISPQPIYRTCTNTERTATSTAAGAGNIDITAKKIDIVESRETSASQTESKFDQSGITVSLSNPVVSAAQTVQRMAGAAENTKSDRMQALAAASAALASKGAIKELGSLMNGAPSSAKDIELNISLGSSSSQNKSTSTSNTARGSSVTAGGNTTIRAVGDAANSDLTIQGGTVQSGDTTTLQADNQVLLLAAANTSSQTSDQSSSSASAGVTVGKGKLGVTVSASQGSGDGNGQDLSYTNTRIQGGKVVNIQSGGDTTIKGGVVKAETVNANVGGNLNIESLQSSSRYKESSQNAGGSVTIGPAPGGSVSAGATKIDSNYVSTTEQSGIKAGDGGFAVNVQGNTDLKAGAITSTQAAIDANTNSFQTAKLTTSDLSNSASYSADSYQVTVGNTGGSAGTGQDSGSANSTTQAAISGLAGNKAARTGDAETGIQKIFDQTAVTKDVNAQVAITQEFGKQAPKAVAEYAQAQFNELKGSNPEEAKKWMEGGIYRVALHATLGALSGGVNGAVGAGTAASAAPLMEQMQDKLAANLENAGLSKEVAAATAKTIAQTTALAAGAAVGGVQGGAMALNVDANNRQLHLGERKLAAQLAAKSAGKYTKEQIEEQMRLMGNEQFNEKPNTGTALIGSDAIVNSVGRDPGMPKAISGNVAVEIVGQANMDIQQYIITNSKDVAGYIPGASPYFLSSLTPNAPTRSNTPPVAENQTANCANMDLACRSGVGVQQSVPMTPAQQKAAGEYFGNMSTQYQRAAALATATGNAPVVLSFEIAAGVTGLLEQALKPSVGKVLVDNSIDMAAVAYSKATGIPIAVINEVVERIIKPAADPLRTKIDQAAASPK